MSEAVNGRVGNNSGNSEVTVTSMSVRKRCITTALSLRLFGNKDVSMFLCVSGCRRLSNNDSLNGVRDRSHQKYSLARVTHESTMRSSTPGNMPFTSLIMRSASIDEDEFDSCGYAQTMASSRD